MFARQFSLSIYSWSFADSVFAAYVQNVLNFLRVAFVLILPFNFAVA